MTETPDAELLKRFIRNDSDEAFTALVARHIDLVHSVAIRQTANPEHAKEITQAVFIVLARKAHSFGANTILSGWLYHTARLTAANFQRAEVRRVYREQEAFMRSNLEESSVEATWTEVEPLLENAMARLNPVDRDAVVLRYFENRSLQQIGAALGVEEKAAQKRVARALEKLRSIFAQQGITASAGIIAGAISAHSVQAAPIALVTTIATTALQGSAVTATTLTLIQKTINIMAWTKVKTVAVAGVALLATLGTATILVRETSQPSAKQSAGIAIDRVRQANIGLPAAQTEAKMLIISAMAQRRIPEAGNWCEALNAQRKLWPVTPTKTTFALNSRMAGRPYTRNEVSSGSIPGDTVIFFETDQPGWNRAGGPELLPKGAPGVAVAFADGTSQIVSAAEVSALRWEP